MYIREMDKPECIKCAQMWFIMEKCKKKGDCWKVMQRCMLIYM